MSIVSKQDATQVLRLSYDDATKSIRTLSTGSINGDPAPGTSVVVGGVDPNGDTQPLQVDSSGGLEVVFPAGSTIEVTQPDGTKLHATIDASALPLGASTEAKQNDVISGLVNVESAVQAVEADTSAITTQLAGVITGTDTFKVDVTASVLPTGAATEVKQDNTITALSSFAAKTASSLVAVPFDNLGMTYVGLTSDIDTVTYKAGATTVAVLTLAYDGNGRLSGVTRS